MVVASASVALVTGYVAFLGTDPLDSEPAFTYGALVAYAVALVLGATAARPRTVGGLDHAQLTATAGIVGWGNAVVRHLVADGSLATVAILALATCGIVWGAIRLGAEPEAPVGPS